MRKLSDYEPVLRKVMLYCAKQTRFECEPSLDKILAENPRLIVSLMHASPLSWIPTMALLALQTASNGGRDRAPMGVVDNFFFHLPGLREVAQYLTQTDRPLSYVDLATQFRQNEEFDLVLFPEGSNCFFGPPDEMQEFRSPKFVELSIETGVPLLLGVHTGSENWSVTIPVPEKWMSKFDVLPTILSSFLEKRLRQTGQLTLPLPPLPMNCFSLRCELYCPQLKKEDLSGEIEERREQIRTEGQLIHQRMRQMLEGLLSKSPVD